MNDLTRRAFLGLAGRVAGTTAVAGTVFARLHRFDPGRPEPASEVVKGSGLPSVPRSMYFYPNGPSGEGYDLLAQDMKIEVSEVVGSTLKIDIKADGEPVRWPDTGPPFPW